MNSRSGLAYPDVVDLVTHTPDEGEWKLIIVEEALWDGSPEQILKLQQKLNNYLSFALDGQMQRLYPSSAGKRVVVQLDCYERPDQQTLAFLDIARKRMLEQGVGFYINIVPDQTLQG
jgi:hypothetical protein